MAFVDGLIVQRRVLGALVSREIYEATGRGAYKLVLAIVEPIVAVGIAVIWHTLLKVQPPYGDSRVLFISSGLYPTYVFVHVSCEFRSLSKGSNASRRFPVEKTLDHVLAACFIKAVLYAIIGLVGFTIIYLNFSKAAWPFDWPTVILAFLGLSSIGLGIGITNAAIEQLIPVWKYVWNPLARGLILFSGVIYVPDFLRPDVRYFLSWNPVLQGVELFRLGFFPGYPRLMYSPWYFWGLAGGFILGGLALERAFRHVLDDG